MSCSCPQVRFWSSGEESSPRRVTVAAGETSARLRGLRSQLEYHAAVRAYNSAGAGPFSATVNATTKKTRTYLLCGGAGVCIWNHSPLCV